MPLLTKEPWFGPKRVAGWGWRPQTWQGWAVIAGMVTLIALDVAFFRGTGYARMGAIGVVVVGVVVIAMTAEPPGGPKQ